MKMNAKLCQALCPTALFAAVSLVTACSGDDDVTTTLTPHDVTITALQPGSRMGFDASGVGFWQTGDAITVVSENGSTKYMSKFTMTEGAGTAKATFTGKVQGSLLACAFYPYNENHGYDGENYTFCFPDTYTYSSVDQNYSVVEGNSFCMPMMAEFTEDNQTTVAFKHIGSVLAIKIDRMPSAAGTLTVTAKENITGKAAFEENSTLVAPTEGGKTVTFNYSGATAMASGVFYLPLPAGTYTSGLAVTVAGEGTNGETKSTFYTTNDITIDKGHIKALTVNTNYSKTIDGHDFIDLGLPSGLLWADANIGAKDLGDAGSYFAWGEKTAGTNFDGSAYDSSLMTKYTSDGDVLASSDDAATVNWGSKCRMPEPSDFTELLNNTTLTYTTVADDEDGVGYCEVKSKTNGQSIMLPFGGHYTGNTSQSGTLQNDGTVGYYWTSVLGNGNAADCFVVGNGSAAVNNLGRVYGASVRAVAKP